MAFPNVNYFLGVKSLIALAIEKSTYCILSLKKKWFLIWHFFLPNQIKSAAEWIQIDHNI